METFGNKIVAKSCEQNLYIGNVTLYRNNSMIIINILTPLSKIETFGNTFQAKVANKYFLFKLKNNIYQLKHFF